MNWTTFTFAGPIIALFVFQDGPQAEYVNAGERGADADLHHGGARDPAQQLERLAKSRNSEKTS